MLYRLLAGVILMLLATSAHAQKVGIGAWENPALTMLEWVERGERLGWYYNWRSDQIHHRGNLQRSVEFVPMIHGAKNVNDRIRSDLPVRALLGFNEPDGKAQGQTNITVEKAVALWPKLQAHGLRLGSPATTREGTLGKNSWQRRFMDQVAVRGLRVDFMAVHYYSPDGDVATFERWLRTVHAEYRRPIWVTEFGMVDWSNPGKTTRAQNAAFAMAAIQMMERLPFVERHAWFAANPYSWGGSTIQTNLVDNDLNTTVVGAAFERIAARLSGMRLADAGE